MKKGAAIHGAEDQSFDPRTWAESSAAPSVTASPVPAVAAAGFRHWSQVAAVLVLTATAISAYLSRPTASGPVATVPAHIGLGAARPSPQVAALASRTLKLPGIGDLESALAESGLDPDQARAAATAALSVMPSRAGEVRAVMRLAVGTDAPRLERLEVSFQDSSGAIVSRRADGQFAASPVAASLDTVVTRLAGEIDAESFYSSAVAAGVPDTLVSQIAQAFVYDFDFQREISPGNTFEVVFEQQRNTAGEAVGQARLLFASLSTDDKSRSLYWFKPGIEEGGWFDGNGASVIRSLMRTPVDGARVSSSFGYRVHPVLGYKKLHRGTDFAAPSGTPIFAAGGSTVEFAGMRGAAGNMVVLRHDNGWQTRYFHLSRFAPGAVVGTRMTQGQQIGDVGTTGRSTGPHLHYEVLIDGEQVDPMTIQTDAGITLTGDARAVFIRERDRIDLARAARSEVR